ncbi:DUF6113 family protein [Streptomyces sp. NPDC005963]|uniref:DUF6113 family protein n=1 Tax=Streptomyces sp. NPDC005963 TaxID=3156721 RepID=UPI0033D4197E
MSGGNTPGAWLTRPARPGRIAAYLGLALFGAVVGIAGSLVQGAWFPGGLLLALLASGALFYGSARTTGTQLGAIASGAGWLIAIVVLSTGRSEGDGLFSAGIGPLAYIVVGMALAVMCATMVGAAQPNGDKARLDR